MGVTRVGGGLLLVGAGVAGYLAWLAETGAPVGLGGPDVQGHLMLVVIGLFGAGSLLLAGRPTAELRGRASRGGLLLVATGAGSILLAAVRASQPGVHADADALAVDLFLGGLLGIMAGLVVMVGALLAAPGPGRRFALVVIASVPAAIVAMSAGDGGISITALVALAVAFGCLGGWAIATSFDNPDPRGRPAGS